MTNYCNCFLLLVFIPIIIALQDEATDPYRLPKSIRPSTYNLSLEIGPDTFTENGTAFSGTVTIVLDVVNQTKKIILNSSNKSISITDIKIGDETIVKDNYSVNATTDILTISCKNNLEVGQSYKLIIKFNGELSTDLNGLYKSKFNDSEGVMNYLTTTQFQPADARKAFPCWDEPEFKARFFVRIIHPAGLVALSNTPGKVLNKKFSDTAMITTEFEETPVMSTYLLAFVVSNFTCTVGENVGEVGYRVCSKPDSSEERKFAVDIGPKILEVLNNFTDYNYGKVMAKMDQISIPDYTFGAMENWGLVTYSESNLLYKPNETLAMMKMLIAVTITHEFAHQWFGNLVTCNWWSETFLNEGFATLLEYYITDVVKPHWEVMNFYVMDKLHEVLKLDSNIFTKPLQSKVSTYAEIERKFDGISYVKGSAIFRMLMYVLGPDNFQEALRKYIKDYAFKTTLPEQLWQCLESTIKNETSKLPTDLKTVMENWIKLPGYPLLTVSLIGNKVTISQERFVLKHTDLQSKWYVPITYATSTDIDAFSVTTPREWLTPESNLTFYIPDSAEWVVLNNNQTGYYRVNYDPDLWMKIGENGDKFPEITRGQIVDDVFSLVTLEKLTFSNAFEIVNFLEKDGSYFVWKPALDAFVQLLSRYEQRSRLKKELSKYVKHMVRTLYNTFPLDKLKLEDEAYVIKQRFVAAFACYIGLDDCVRKTKKAFEEFRFKSKSPSKDLNFTVLCSGLSFSEDPQDWDFLWRGYLHTNDPKERNKLIKLLGCSTDKAQLKHFLLKTVDPSSGLRAEDRDKAFGSVCDHQAGVDVAFDFLMTYQKRIENSYTTKNPVVSLLKKFALKLTSRDQVTKLQDLVDSGHLAPTVSAIAKAVISRSTYQITETDKHNFDLEQYFGVVNLEVDRNESLQPEFRLSKIYQPINYTVDILVPSKGLKSSEPFFYGKVIIHFNVSRTTTKVQLHACTTDIDIEEIFFDDKAMKVPRADPNTDIVAITFSSGLKPNRTYQLEIHYEGTFGKGVGFYINKYTNNNEETKFILATKFVPNFARKAFPCFDEPSFKAVFEITITCPQGYKAWSNTHGKVVERKPGNMVKYRFEPTPVMSTYMVAFILSDFTCSFGLSVGDASYQVCSSNDYQGHTAWALEIGPKLMSEMNDYTGYDYSNTINKIEQFAMPEGVGVVEGWGLVSYRYFNLLWDPETSLNIDKQSITGVIAHEIAHQWFGSLVTCSWWSEFYVNEGFATYLEFFIPHKVLPEWQLDKHFILEVHQHALSIDSQLSVQPLESPASTSGEVKEKFNQIIQLKGACLIRMLEHVIGTNKFNTAVKLYIQNNKFKNIKSKHLWSVLEKYVNSNVSKLPDDLGIVMGNWIKTPGYPIVNVQKSKNKLMITQKRFLTSREDNSSAWYVPITYTTSGNVSKFEDTAPSLWITPDSSPVINLPEGTKWVILNNLQTAYYRTNYSDSIWEALRGGLLTPNFSGIPEMSRAQIVDDVLVYARYDMMTYTQAFKIIEFMENDNSYFTWSVFRRKFNWLLKSVGMYTALGRQMRNHVSKFISKLYDSNPASKINEGDHIYTLKQVLAVELACRVHYDNCVLDIRKHFTGFVQNGTLPPKNIRKLVYCNGLRFNGTTEEWDYVRTKYVEAKNTADRNIFVTSLGCITNKSILTQYLNMTITPDSKIRKGDRSSVFASICSNPLGARLAFQFYKDNQDAIIYYFKNWGNVANLIKNMANQFRTQQDVDELSRFVKSGAINSEFAAAGYEAIQLAQMKLDWITKHEKDFKKYYVKNQPRSRKDSFPDAATTTTSTTSRYNIIKPSSISILFALVASFLNIYE